MSFSVNQGSTTVYTLPNDSGVSGAVLTSGGSGATALWATLPSDRMYGEVIMWWSASSSFSDNTDGGKSPSINGSVESDWYLCDGSSITTNSDDSVTLPNMIGRVPVGAESSQDVASAGNTEITSTIPIPYHRHGFEGSTGQWQSDTGNLDGRDFGHDLQVGSQHNIGADMRNKQRINVENDQADRQVVAQIDGITITGSVTTTGNVQGGHNHSHEVNVSCGTGDYNTDYSGSSGSKIFKYYKLYYIIYLP